MWGSGGFWQHLVGYKRALRHAEKADQERAERAKQPSCRYLLAVKLTHYLIPRSSVRAAPVST